MGRLVGYLGLGWCDESDACETTRDDVIMM
jgi:hypothetical protein